MRVKGPGKFSVERKLLEELEGVGLQATELSRAARVVREMRKHKALTILTFTSNLATSGLRESFALLARERKVDVIITSVGAIEEDIMKTANDFPIASFDENDANLHAKGRNRVGNVIIPSTAYEWFEGFMQKKLLPLAFKEQKRKGTMLSPRELFALAGTLVKDKDSFIFQAAKNNIPIFCPSPMDGAFGLQCFFFKQSNRAFGVDVTADMGEFATMVLAAKKAGALILGGGAPKHYCIGANLLRGGLDYAVYITTADPYDGSLSGAPAREAVSWGKIRSNARAASVHCDASIAFPLLLQSFW